jgi:hypothetical protein
MHSVVRHCSGKGEEKQPVVSEAVPGDVSLGSEEVPAVRRMNCGEELKPGAGA